ncbi:MAG: UDP-2,3-diacylglucosamine diphosphatase [Proteobacteria bacterium]|nr:UDP-2,3-diacylglucosamine diphosphatase [Pseudomonadota bacterium]
MAVVFVSDVHLERGRADISERFFRFLELQARQADALYLLGDLFEAWVGDDDDDDFAKMVPRKLRALSDSGVPVYFMHGNRDFLIGERFAKDSGCQLLDDPTRLELHGETLLLSHGDSLCTDDLGYQAFRKEVRDPQWQQRFLAQPLAQRREFARRARDASAQYQQRQPPAIGDVNQQAVEALMTELQVTLLLHGHTHRPAVHDFTLADGVEARRIVLGAWYEQGSMVRWDKNGIELIQGF